MVERGVGTVSFVVCSMSLVNLVNVVPTQPLCLVRREVNWTDMKELSECLKTFVGF